MYVDLLLLLGLVLLAAMGLVQAAVTLLSGAAKEDAPPIGDGPTWAQSHKPDVAPPGFKWVLVPVEEDSQH